MSAGAARMGRAARAVILLAALAGGPLAGPRAVLLAGPRAAVATAPGEARGAAPAPGDRVWWIDSGGAIHSRFSAESPCPLRRVEFATRVLELDASGRRRAVAREPVPAFDPRQLRGAVDTPYGRLVVRADAIALEDSTTGAALWQHAFASPLALAGHPGLQPTLPATMAYSPSEHDLLAWKCSLDGESLHGSDLFRVDIASGAVRKIITIGSVVNTCVPLDHGFVAVLNRQGGASMWRGRGLSVARDQTLACYDRDGARGWWRTVRAGEVQRVDRGGGAPVLLVRQRDDGGGKRRARALLLDGGSGKVLLSAALPFAGEFVAAPLDAARRLVVAGTVEEVDAGDGASQACIEVLALAPGAEAPLWRHRLRCAPQAAADARTGRIGGPLLAAAAITASPGNSGLAAVAFAVQSGPDAGRGAWVLLEEGGAVLLRRDLGELDARAIRGLQLLDGDRYLLVAHATTPALFAIE